MSAEQAAGALAEGVRIAVPDAEIVSVPMADGGEGTVQSLIDGLGGGFISREVQDPLGRPVTAVYGITDNGIAVIEMAQASGLTILSKNERNPLYTSTYGTGQLIIDALDRGAREFIIGIGGSATNDGGAGMAQALGYQLLDKFGNELTRGGGALSDLAHIVVSGADARIGECKFKVACDVDNPLTGPNGASAIFGPQKGATPEKVELLDIALARLAYIMEEDMGRSVANIPGSGAAGGLGAGCLAFLNAELKKGVDIVIEATGLDGKIEGSALVITGEGCTDSQTLSGKTVYGVTDLAKRMGVPAIVISGSLSNGADELLKYGALRLYAIMEDDIWLEDAMRYGAELLKNKTAQVVSGFFKV